VQRLAVLGAAMALVIACAVTPACAAEIVQPGASYMAFAAGPATLAPFTIVAQGFSPGSRVYVEQCDGTSPSASQWSPTIDCDLGTSPAGASADSRGRVAFDARDRNHAFRPFRGTSPEGLFNCLGPHQASPHNGLLDSRRCSVRVSTTNAAATGDQVFFALVVPDPPGASVQQTTGTTAVASPAAEPAAVTANPASATAPANTTSTSVPASHSGPSSLAFTGGFTMLLLVVGLEAVAVGLILMGRRRTRAASLRR
jgi:hypothetical protein